MRRLRATHASTQHSIRLAGRDVHYRVVWSKAAHKLRVRVGPDGVELVHPANRSGDDASGFLVANETWVLNQIERVERLGVVRRQPHPLGRILFRGEPTFVRVEAMLSRTEGNLVRKVQGEIVVRRGPRSRTSVARSLELWLRREARREIAEHVAWITTRVRAHPGRVYVMNQRTKWGNCSSRRNLSFNWRLILAPDYVLRYLVTHEAVHLVIPDHSAKFWLTVQSLCPETERARQWLVAHSGELDVDLSAVVAA